MPPNSMLSPYPTPPHPIYRILHYQDWKRPCQSLIPANVLQVWLGQLRDRDFRTWPPAGQPCCFTNSSLHRMSSRFGCWPEPLLPFRAPKHRMWEVAECLSLDDTSSVPPSISHRPWSSASPPSFQEPLLSTAIASDASGVWNWTWHCRMEQTSAE